MTQSRDLPVIGVVGGIGSGKSSVSRRLARRRSVAIIDADRIGHDLLHNPDIIKQLTDHFGESVLDGTGLVDRAAIAAKVFGPTSQHTQSRLVLESIVHPRIRETIREQISEFNNNPDVEAVILDAALLLETGWDRDCDTVVFIDTPEPVRRRRVMQNRGWTAEEFDKREANQLSLSEKKQRAEHIVNNGTSLDIAAAELAAVVDGLVRKNSPS